MAETVQEIAAGLSQATQGQDRPNAMTISRPAKEAIWAVFAVLVVISLLDVLNTLLMAIRMTSATTAVDIVHWFGWGLIIGRISEALIVFAIVSSRIARIEATVGAAHVDLNGTAGG